MTLFYICISLFCLIGEIHSLICLSCRNVTSPYDCHTDITCNKGQECYTDVIGFGLGSMLNFGCRSALECLGSGSASLIGRSTDGAPCSQCCVADRCNEKLCVAGSQVHGGWSSWGNWTSCSNTCGIGTQSRRRDCDNPVPKLAGDHCFGDSVDFRACFMKGCQDGGWSLWTSWSSCTSGRKIRTRLCNNPNPSYFGRGCYGNNKEWNVCQLNQTGVPLIDICGICHVTGSNTSYMPLSSGGMTTIVRSGPVAFTATQPTGQIVDGHPIFNVTVTNVGGGFDPSTGIFTCPVAGLYEFGLSITARQADVYCFISKIGVSNAYARIYNSSIGLTVASKRIDFQLSVGDTVSLQNCVNWNLVNVDSASSFNGTLIH